MTLDYSSNAYVLDFHVYCDDSRYATVCINAYKSRKHLAFESE